MFSNHEASSSISRANKNDTEAAISDTSYKGNLKELIRHALKQNGDRMSPESRVILLKIAEVCDLSAENAFEALSAWY